MLKLSKRYRKGYTGEEIIQERVFSSGQWHSTTEHVPNNIINNQISNRAVVFGNGPTRALFDTAHLLKHKSGLLGADTLQSYGCNAIYRDHTVDFLVCADRRVAKELVDSGYTADNIVYTRVDISLEFPKNFYLIPHDPYADAGTTAMYIAAFDGHKKIYLLGFDGQDTPGYNSNIYAGTNGYDSVRSDVPGVKWIENAGTLFRIYNDVEFVWVTHYGTSPVHENWKFCPNLRQIGFREFVLEADL